MLFADSLGYSFQEAFSYIKEKSKPYLEDILGLISSGEHGKAIGSVSDLAMAATAWKETAMRYKSLYESMRNQTAYLTMFPLQIRYATRGVFTSPVTSTESFYHYTIYVVTDKQIEDKINHYLMKWLPWYLRMLAAGK
jgi:hypothetical protein